jgi:alpha-methylacyl-CoA racemase
MNGPLAGLAVVELAGIGPAPFAGMVLADLGAEVLRIDRPGGSDYPGDPRHDLLNRGKRSAVVDLKHPDGVRVARALAARADVLLEGFRPGVAERLGIGPEVCLAANPRLVYCRATGWGQEGPRVAGHDLTYLAATGVLDGLPGPPANLLGDFGAGGMLLVAGALAALWRTHGTGEGQVVDAAVTDGVGLLATQLLGLRADGLWGDRPGENLLDGGAPFYATYRTADQKRVAVAALEPRFFAELVDGLELTDVPEQYDRSAWPRLRRLLEQRFATRTRDEWAERFGGDSDACVAPVLSWDEAAYPEAHGVRQAAPAPRFSGTPWSFPGRPPPHPGEHTREALRDWGVPDLESLIATGVAVQAG